MAPTVLLLPHCFSEVEYVASALPSSSFGQAGSCLCAEGCGPCRASCVQLWAPCPRHDLFPQPPSFLTVFFAAAQMWSNWTPGSWISDRCGSAWSLQPFAPQLFPLQAQSLPPQPPVPPHIPSGLHARVQLGPPGLGCFMKPSRSSEAQAFDAASPFAPTVVP